MKLMHGDFIAYAAQDVKGKPMLPRDALMAALYGKGPVVVLPSGRVLRPMATRIEMSQMMDNIASDPGDLMWRDESKWVPLHAPDVPAFLVFDPSQGYLWVQASDVGGGSPWVVNESGSANNINANFKANQMQPFQDFILQEVALQNGWGGAGNIKLYLFEGNFSNDQLNALIWKVDVPAVAGSAGKIVVVPIPETVLLAGHRYFIGVASEGDPGTANTVLWTGAPTYGGLPLKNDPARYHLTDDTPSVGQSLSFGSGANTFCIFLRGK